jgi:succinate dehydrogenase subunit C (EC 1.3.5.1)
MLPVLLWLFQGGLASSETFAAVKGVVGHPVAKIVLLGLIWFYMHHFCAGIRYLLLDLHKGIELEAARLSSKIVFAVSIALTLIIGAKVLW